MPMTAAPGSHMTARWPPAATRPENSRPGISWAIGGPGYCPIRWRRSARFRAVATTSTRTSSGPGSGSGTDSTVRTSGPPWDRRTTARMVGDSGASARRSLHGGLEAFVERVEELLGGLEGLVLADEQRQILRHPTALHRLHADPLQGLGEVHHLRRAVLVAPELQAAGPGEDRRDRVGRGLLTALVLA